MIIYNEFFLINDFFLSHSLRFVIGKTKPSEIFLHYLVCGTGVGTLQENSLNW